MEIGSEFSICFNEITEPNNLLMNENTLLLNYGRTALRFILEGIKVNGIIIPNYLCESIIKPLKEIGIPYEFYEVDKNLQIIQGDLENLLKPGWAVFLLNYFNIKRNIETISFLQNIRKTNIIIEDITHSLFDLNEPIGHFQIASIRKWLGIPSGALIRDYYNGELQNQVLTNNCNINASVVQQRFYAANLKRLYIKNQLSKDAKLDFLNLFLEAENTLDESKVEVQAIDRISNSILSTYDYKTMIETRRKNYKILYNGLKKVSEVEIINGIPDSKKVPLGFPIKSQDRDKLRSALIDEDIYPPIHWPLPAEFKPTDEILDISKSILTLPCDQRYTEKDMNRIINVIIKHYGG